MSKSKANAAQEQVYPTAVLLKSKALSGFQRDFVKAILTKPYYTINEAVAAVRAVLG